MVVVVVVVVVVVEKRAREGAAETGEVPVAHVGVRAGMVVGEDLEA
jgi:hypothetical protein